MTETYAKLRALLIAGLMVASVFATSVALSGTAAADTIDRGTGGDAWDTSTGSGNIGPGATLYQGEGDFTYTGESSFPEDFERASGSNEGVVLSDPIPQDQPTGSYESTSAGETLTVQTPRITDADVYLGSSGTTSVEGSTVSAETDTVRVVADYNFRNAEDLQIGVYEGDSDGLDTTRAALASGENATKRGDATGDVTWELDLGDLDSGQYTVEVGGADDLAWGDAAQTMSFNKSGVEDVTLDLEESEAVSGQNVRYDLTGGVVGDYHVVSIDQSDVDGDATQVFRAVGTTVRVNASGGNAWALVELEGGHGVGQIETGQLDDTDVRIEVSDPVTAADTPEGVDPADWDGTREGHSIPDDANDATLSVTEGEISLENPTDSYVPGAQVTVNGTVAESYDEVSVFAKNQGDYQRVEIDGDETITATEGEFEAEEVNLVHDGNGGGNDLLSLPGTYRFAVVAGPANDKSTGEPAGALTASELVQNVSDRVSLRVTEADFEVNTSIIDGEVAEGDRIEVWGVAEGADEINVSFIGPRGTFDQYGPIPVEADGTFEDENVRIGDNIRDRFRSEIISTMGGADGAADVAEASIPDDFSRLSRGEVVMSVGHKGRDGMMGDGVPPDASATIELVSSDGGNLEISRSGLPGLIYNINTGSWTQGQVVERLLEETSRATASDDESQSFQFRLTSPRTTVDNVVGENGVNGTVELGNELTVQGTTNRQPDSTVLSVEVIDGPSQDEFDFVAVEEWGTDGQWNATLQTEGLQPGTYTIEASDGDSSDVTEFDLSENSTTETETPTETATSTETATPTDELGVEVNETETATETPTETEGEDGPGFGLLVSLIALVAAALLAARRAT